MNNSTLHSTSHTTSIAEVSTRSAAPLRNRLRLNAAFSLVTGIIAATAAGPISDLFGLEQTWVIRAMGLALIGFSVILVVIAGQQTSTVQALAAPIVMADLGWVAGTGAVIALGWLSTAGAITMALLAVVVLELAVVQWRARSRMTAQRTPVGPDAAGAIGG